MAINLGDAILYYRGDLSALNASIGQAQGAVNAGMGNILSATTSVGLGFTAMGAAITGGFVLAGKAAMTASGSWANVATLGVKDMDKLKAGVEGLAMTYGTDLNEAIDTTYQTLSAGIPEDAAVMVLDAAARGAQAGVSTLAEALDLGTSALNAWNLKGATAEETTRNFETIMGQAATAARDGKTTISDMSQSIGAVAPVMSSAGIGTKEFFSAVSALTATGMPASQAMIGLKGAVSNILKPGKEATDMASALGIDFNVTALKTKGLTGFLQDLKEKVEANTPALMKRKESLHAEIVALQLLTDKTKEQSEYLKGLQKEYKGLDSASSDTTANMAQLFGSIEGVNAILSLTGAQGEAYTRTLDHMSDGQRNLNEMSAAFREGNYELAWNKMKSTMEVLAVTIGDAILPAFVSMTDIVVPVLRSIVDFARDHPTITTGVTMVGGAFGLLSTGLGLALLSIRPFVSAWTLFHALTAGAGVAGAAGGAAAMGSGIMAVAGALIGPIGLGVAIAVTVASLGKLAVAIYDHIEACRMDAWQQEQGSAAILKIRAALDQAGVAYDDTALATMNQGDAMTYLMGLYNENARGLRGMSDSTIEWANISTQGTAVAADGFRTFFRSVADAANQSAMVAWNSWGDFFHAVSEAAAMPVEGYAAGGTVAGAGRIVPVVAGELGPELATFPGGASTILGRSGPGVYALPVGTHIATARETAGMQRFAGGGTVQAAGPSLTIGTINIANRSDADYVLQELTRMFSGRKRALGLGSLMPVGA